MTHLARVVLANIYPLNSCSVGRRTIPSVARDITVVVQIISGRKQLQHSYFLLIKTHTADRLNKALAAFQHLDNSINVRKVKDSSMLVLYDNLNHLYLILHCYNITDYISRLPNLYAFRNLTT